MRAASCRKVEYQKKQNKSHTSRSEVRGESVVSSRLLEPSGQNCNIWTVRPPWANHRPYLPFYQHAGGSLKSTNVTCKRNIHACTCGQRTLHASTCAWHTCYTRVKKIRKNCTTSSLVLFSFVEVYDQLSCIFEQRTFQGSTRSTNARKRINDELSIRNEISKPGNLISSMVNHDRGRRLFDRVKNLDYDRTSRKFVVMYHRVSILVARTKHD